MMSKYQLQISSKAKKELKKIDKKAQKRIITSILNLKINPRPRQFKTLSGRKLADFRLRIGDYRVLYDVYEDDGVVLVLKVGHRKDVYR